MFEQQPSVSVGIMSAPTINFCLNGVYRVNGAHVSGPQRVSVTADGHVEWSGVSAGSLLFEATSPECSFTLKGVTIGVNFHWERKEDQTFRGDLRIIVSEGITAVNIVPVESYLESVISSEMSATASAELLKAHAVISRSWLLAQIGEKKSASDTDMIHSDDEIVKWYDRDNHTLFDVCADDHCQRYQGITRQTTGTVAEAVRATAGLVLTDDDGELCDARFSKCCGGVFEEFENCWQPRHYRYLTARRDNELPLQFPDLRIEENAEKWILGTPESFCNTADAGILTQVLNNYDQETTRFYRWTVRYTQAEISDLVHRRSGIDFGTVTSLEALERGTSGRIVRLRITGTLRTMVIGKELEIRRTLSESHLYSSAFVVRREGTDFVLHGAGWGHGVGLCQIGAAVMGARGYGYRQILSHYFPGADISQMYKIQ